MGGERREYKEELPGHVGCTVSGLDIQDRQEDTVPAKLQRKHAELPDEEREAFAFRGERGTQNIQ